MAKYYNTSILHHTSYFSNKPNLIKNYIIAGPALQWNDREVFNREEQFSKSNSTLNANVYTSIGNLDNKTIKEPWNAFNEQIVKRNYRGLKWKSEVIKEETHLSMFPSALTRGLKIVLNKK